MHTVKLLIEAPRHAGRSNIGSQLITNIISRSYEAFTQNFIRHKMVPDI